MDEERPGRPADVVSEETIEKIHDMILDDRRTKAREVAKAIGVSIGTAIYVLNAKLAMKKWSTRWVPRLLTVDNNPMRLLTSQHCLKQFKGDLKNFLRRVVIIDEAWIRHYTPETTQQSRQWISPDESAPRKANTVPSAGKVMTTIVLGREVRDGVILQ